MFPLAIALSAALAGCGEKTVDPPATSLTYADFAAICAGMMAKGSGGFLLYVRDASAIAHGGDLPRPEKRGGRAIADMRDVTLTRSRNDAAGGKTYAHSHPVFASIGYTFLFGTPRSYYYQGNTEVKLVDTLFKGSVTIPTLTAADSGWSTINLFHTDSALYYLQGRFLRYGTYTLPGTSKTYTGRIETTTLIPGVKVDPATGMIVDGDVLVGLKGKDASGETVEASCTYQFRPGQPIRIIINGDRPHFILDDDKGSATPEQ